MKVLETRNRGGMRFRRYRAEDGRTLRTLELPESVLRTVGMTKVKDAMARFLRGEALRQRKRLIQQRVAEGVKPTAVAHELGVTEQRVRQVRKEMQREHKTDQ